MRLLGNELFLREGFWSLLLFNQLRYVLTLNEAVHEPFHCRKFGQRIFFPFVCNALTIPLYHDDILQIFHGVFFLFPLLSC